MPVHERPGMITSIVNAVTVSSPQLYKQSFKADANVAPAQHFLSAHGDKHFERQTLRLFKEEDNDGRFDAPIPDKDLIEYKVTHMPNFNMKDRGTAEAEEREEMIKENQDDIRELKKKRQAKGLMTKIKREIQILESDQRLGYINMTKILE